MKLILLLISLSFFSPQGFRQFHLLTIVCYRQTVRVLTLFETNDFDLTEMKYCMVWYGQCEFI